jgi:hypothetical protein
VRFYSVLDPSQMCYYVSEVLDAGLVGPLFKVLSTTTSFSLKIVYNFLLVRCITNCGVLFQLSFQLYKHAVQCRHMQIPLEFLKVLINFL